MKEHYTCGSQARCPCHSPAAALRSGRPVPPLVNTVVLTLDNDWGWGWGNVAWWASPEAKSMGELALPLIYCGGVRVWG